MASVTGLAGEFLSIPRCLPRRRVTRRRGRVAHADAVTTGPHGETPIKNPGKEYRVGHYGHHTRDSPIVPPSEPF
jgi:hypothetical protein